MRFKIAAIAVLICNLAACGPKPEAKSESHAVVTVGSTEIVNGTITKQSGLKITNAYIKPALGQGTATAAYMTIENTGEAEDRLISVSCDCAGMATLHTMAMKGDMMTMGEAEGGFAIAPNQTLTLAPGGNHIMLMGLKAAPPEGSVQKLTLHFAKSGNVVLDAPVKAMP